MTGLKSGSGDDLWADDGEDDAGEDGAGAESAPEPDGDDSTASDDAGVASERSDERSSGSTGSGLDTSSVTTEPTSGDQPYIVRRAVQDKSVQFERDERLTFFVHDDVVEGERDLITDVEAALGRDVPKFDVREAVYRAALRHPESVLEELLEMGYTAKE